MREGVQSSYGGCLGPLERDISLSPFASGLRMHHYEE